MDNQLHIQKLLKRLPTFELSYETIAHKKVFNSYNISMAIPTGKKMFAWFTFQKDKDVCFIMELNREKKIIHINTLYSGFDRSLCVGTILYGTIIPVETPATETGGASSFLENEKYFFTVEDIYYYRGISLKNMVFSEKLGYIEQIFVKQSLIQSFDEKTTVLFTLPFLWGIQSYDENGILLEYEQRKKDIPYTVHHLQLRKLNDISPFLNIPLNTILSRMNNRDKEKPALPTILHNPPKIQFTKIEHFVFDYNKPQYKYPTVFQVSADIQFDIYHLFAYGKNNSLVYYNTAYIPNIKISFFMNSLFRNIRENKNLDYIEESDDEEDFENVAEDKYVDLNKVINIECVFHPKFKRWVPVRVADLNARIVHINKLAIY